MTPTSDNAFHISSTVSGVNPLRGRGPVRAFMHRELPLPSRIVAAILVVEDRRSSSRLPVVAEADLEATAREIAALGIRAVKVFVESKAKTPNGSEAVNAAGLGMQSIRRIKDAVPDLCVITDTCLCSYTTDGSCVIAAGPVLDRVQTLDRLIHQADAQLDAGADIIGLAAMLDGAVDRLRSHLNQGERFNVPIMPHLTWRSSLYRLYRAEMSTGSGSQREGFQIDPSCPDQFLAMGKKMAQEGADVLQLQPGLFSMDVVQLLKAELTLPVALYSVSGEYHMLKSLGSTEREFFEVLYEHATASFRAGADYLVTYAWRELASGMQRLITVTP